MMYLSVDTYLLLTDMNELPLENEGDDAGCAAVAGSMEQINCFKKATIKLQ